MSASTLSSAQPARRAPRRFYVALSAFITLIVFVGFWPTYFGPLVGGTVDKIPFIHFHAAIYVGWLALFITQTVLAASGRTRLHIKLGKAGIAYGIVILVVGVAVSFVMFAIRVRAGQMERAQLSLLAPLVDMVVFAPFFAAAVYYRNKPEWHKRLMIVATTSLLIAAAGRMTLLGTPPNPWLVRLVWVSPILLAMAYDLAKRRTVHPIYVTGVVVLIAEGTWRSGARQSETWAEICRWLATFFV